MSTLVIFDFHFDRSCSPWGQSARTARLLQRKWRSKILFGTLLSSTTSSCKGSCRKENKCLFKTWICHREMLSRCCYWYNYKCSNPRYQHQFTFELFYFWHNTFFIFNPTTYYSNHLQDQDDSLMRKQGQWQGVSANGQFSVGFVKYSDEQISLISIINMFQNLSCMSPPHQQLLHNFIQPDETKTKK